MNAGIVDEAKVGRDGRYKRMPPAPESVSSVIFMAFFSWGGLCLYMSEDTTILYHIVTYGQSKIVLSHNSTIALTCAHVISSVRRCPVNGALAVFVPGNTR